MRHTRGADLRPGRVWMARIAVGGVFLVNVSCAISFILWPERYVSGFELTGVPGAATVRGLGILFLMWNATYPPVVYQPVLHKTLFEVVLVQQAIGLAGETWLWLTLPAGHAALLETGLRFIVFDGVGLVLMAITYVMLHGGKRAGVRE